MGLSSMEPTNRNLYFFILALVYVINVQYLISLNIQ